MKKLESGFSAVEGLLIFIIVGIIGGTGWYVMQANKKTNDTLNNAGLGTAAQAVKKKQTTTPQATDPTANWLGYSNKEEHFSFKYPSSWTINVCPLGIIFLGPTPQTAGQCGPNGSATEEITLYSGTGDDRKTYELDSNSYDNFKKEIVTVNNVQGEKESGVLKSGTPYFAVPPGSIGVMYLFYVNGRTYRAFYEQNPTYPDVQSDFNLMVTKTLQFHS